MPAGWELLKKSREEALRRQTADEPTAQARKSHTSRGTEEQQKRRQALEQRAREEQAEADERAEEANKRQKEENMNKIKQLRKLVEENKQKKAEEERQRRRSKTEVETRQSRELAQQQQANWERTSSNHSQYSNSEPSASDEKSKSLTQEAEEMRARVGPSSPKPTVTIPLESSPKASMKEEVEEMRRRLSQSPVKAPKPIVTPEHPQPESLHKSTTSSRNSSNSVYSAATLKKKMVRLEEMIADCLQTHAQDSREHKKLLKKRKEYVTALEQQSGDDDNNNNEKEAKAAQITKAANEKAAQITKAANEKAAKEKQVAQEKEQEAKEAEAREAAAQQQEQEAVAAAKKEAKALKKLEQKELQEASRRQAEQQQEAEQQEMAALKAEAMRRESIRQAAAQKRQQEELQRQEQKVIEEKEALMLELKRKEELLVMKRKVAEKQQEEEYQQRQRQQEQEQKAEEAAKLAQIEAREPVQQQQQQSTSTPCFPQKTEAHPPMVQEIKATPKKEVTQEFLDRRAIPEPYSDNTKKLLRELEDVENRQTKLEKQLKQNGIAISEEIPYGAAKDKIADITEKMKALNVNSSGQNDYAIQKQYYALEEEMAKYSYALMLTDEWAQEQRMAQAKWEAEIQEDNVAALQQLRRHMPVQIRSMTEEELTSQSTPNGKYLPVAIVRKFKRTNVLQLLRMDPDDIEKMHPSLLEGLRTTGLTLTERRALYEHLKEIGAIWQSLAQDPSFERKWMFYESLKSKFKEMLHVYTRHMNEYGPPSNHPYQQRNNVGGGGCPMLGNQCPLKANAAISYDQDYGFSVEAQYEVSDTTKSSLEGPRASPKKPPMARSRQSGGGGNNNNNKNKMSEAETLAAIRERLVLRDDPESDIDKKLVRELMHAEKRTQMLEKQLTMSGITVAEDGISYKEAKEKIAILTQDIKAVAIQMGETADKKEMARLESEYGKVAGELEKYHNAMMLTKEWAQEQLAQERQWEESIRPANIEALQKIRRHMPVKIRDMSEEELTTLPTPNGKILPVAIARKFKRTNILLLLRMKPSAIEPMHPSSIEGLRSTGLTLTERRALYEHLKDLGPKWKTMQSDKMAERKWMWHASLKGKFKETLDKYQTHVDQYGPPGNHPYAKRNDPTGGCPLLGNQCPVKADSLVDYDDVDYGFPSGAEYDVAEVQKSNLLTVEDLQARQKEDQYEEEATSKSGPPALPMGGLLSAIANRKPRP
jgi:hypothetical protein